MICASHRMIPAPSPRGTNNARVFVPAFRFAAPIAAYDSKRGLARDSKTFDPEGELDIEDNHPVVAAMKYARARLNSTECQALKHLLGKAMLSSPKEEDDFEDEGEKLSPEKQARIDEEDATAGDTLLESERWDAARDKRRAKLGKDEPPPFSGRPRPGGSMDPLRANDS